MEPPGADEVAGYAKARHLGGLGVARQLRQAIESAIEEVLPEATAPLPAATEPGQLLIASEASAAKQRKAAPGVRKAREG